MSLVLHYKFNDPSTFTTDSSGNSNTLSAINGILSIDDATYGTVANFSHATVKNYFDLPTVPSAITGGSSRTFSYWLRFTGSGTKIIHGQGEPGSGSVTEHFVAVEGSVISIVRNNSKLQAAYPGNDVWFHLGITYDGVTESLFIDGTLSNSANITLSTQSTGFAIGNSSRYAGNDYSFEGQILDFRVYDDALSDADISTLHSDGPNPGGIVQDGALGYFDANNTDSYTSGSETMYDLLGSDLTMVTVPGLVPPLNDGGLDFSTQTNYMQTSKKIVIRTISLWYKKTDSVLSNPVFLDEGEYGFFIQNTLGGTGTRHGSFFSSCTVYVDGVETNLSDWNNLAHGELHNVVFMGSQDSVESILTIFANPAPAYTFRAILYSILLYGRELTDEELIQNYNAGPGIDVQIDSRKFNQATITAAAGLSLNFAEFELYTVEGVNIAVLGTASNTRTDYGGEASRGNDGDTNPDWAGGSVVHTDPGGTWTLDFDQEYSQGVLDKVIFYNRLTSNERSIGALIRLHSSDGEDPLLVGTCTDEAIQTFVITAPVTEEEEEEEEVVVTSVHWVQDSNSRYEVSSKYHLLQIMQNGSYLDNTGSTPANYRSVSFVQTADIDLESDITNIVPISTFTGTYDGQNFAISNWSCTPISGKGTAMFGYTNRATIQNVHLNGVWSTLNTNDGSLFAAHNSSSTFTNISTNFSSGTEVTAVANSLGGLFSYTGSCTVQNVTLGGTFDTFQGTAYTGGIVGYSSGSTYSHVRNIATFVTPLIGHVTGGIAGYYGGTSGYILNAMRGDIQGGNRTGGVYGMSSGGLNYVCNSMIGNISGTSAAGVVSSISSGGTCSFIVNYMTGDVAHGLMGSASSTTLVNSIVAMTGATSSAAFGSGHGSSQVLLDESYGITYTSNAGTVSTMDTSAFEKHESFDQPYWEFTNSPQWPFVFGNVSGTTSDDWMTVVGSGDSAVFKGVSVLNSVDPEPQYVQDGLLAFFDANNEASYTPGATVLNDILGSSGLTMISKPGVATSLNNGGLDYSAGNNYLRTTSTVSIQTVSLWYEKVDSNTNGNTIYLYNAEEAYVIQRSVGSYGTATGSWLTDGKIYVDGEEVSVNEWNDVADGVLHNVVFVGGHPSAEITFTVLANPNDDWPCKAIFHSVLLYDRALTEEEILTNYGVGPSGYTDTDAVEQVTFTVSPSVFFIDVAWEAIDDALLYKVEFSTSSSTLENSVVSGTSTRLLNLEPNSSYTISLFSSSDTTTYEQVGSSGSFSTLENVVANIDVETLRNSEGVFDISNFEGDDLDEHMNTLFETGDQIIRSVNNEPVTTTFVKDGESYPLDQGVFSFAFSPSIGAGQTASLGDANISYDEVNDAIVVDGVSYADGESFEIEGKIVTVYNI